MACKKCSESPAWTFTNKRTLCKSCFVRYFERKINYTLRKYGMINKEDTLGLLVSGTHGKLLSNLIGRICESYGIKFIQISKFSKNKKFSKIAVDDCLDTTAVKIVSLITSKSIKGLYTTKPYYESEFGNVIIKPFYFLLDKELTLYEDITGIKRNKKLVKNKISSLIDGLEKEHPELKSSIVNGSLKINYC